MAGKFSLNWNQVRLSGVSDWPVDHQAGETALRRLTLNLPLDLPWRRVFCSWWNWDQTTADQWVNRYDLPADSSGSVTFFRGTEVAGVYPLTPDVRVFPCRMVQRSEWSMGRYALQNQEVGLAVGQATDFDLVLAPRIVCVHADRAELVVTKGTLQDVDWFFELFLGVESFDAPPGG